MEGKLIKNHYGFEYFLMDEKGETIATLESGKLSIKNCEAIENGYDLDKLAEKEYPDIEEVMGVDISELLQIAYVKGAKTILEILGDKKFSEDDLVSFGKRCFYKGFEKSENDDANCYTAFREEIGELIHSLQVKEWNVEIVTKPYTEVGEGFELESKREPKLDADGCLILIKK